MSSAKQHEMQRIYEKYIEEKGIYDGTVDVQDLAGWAIQQKLISPNPQDMTKIVAENFSRMFREEIRTSPDGKRYRAKHAVKEKVNGKQTTLWADLDNPNVPTNHFRKAFAQRRMQIVGDCFQLKTDVDVCNSKREDAQIQLLLDFTDDVAEAEYMRDYKVNAA